MILEKLRDFASNRTEASVLHFNKPAEVIDCIDTKSANPYLYL
jgi:hypothetical protein